MLWISANQLVSGVCLFVSFLDKATICQSDLLTAFDDATAKVPTGFWIDHGGNMLLGLQVKEEFLAALRLLPECKKKTEAQVHPRGKMHTLKTLGSSEIIVTSQSWGTSAWPHCNRYELPVQHSCHTLAFERTTRDKVKHCSS